MSSVSSASVSGLEETPPTEAAVNGELRRGSYTLPERPLITIRPIGTWAALNLRDLWDYRDLLYFLTLRDIKVRYKQAALGAAWVIIQPVATMLLFTVIFGKIAGMDSDGMPYHLFAFAGLLPWTFFANAVTNGGNSLIISANLITKVYFPRMIIPAAVVLAGLIDLAISFAVLAVIGVSLSWHLLLLPFLVVLLALLATAVGLWMSALNVKYRDIRYALPFIVQLWMFATPIIYPASKVPAKWRWVLAVNPLTGIIEGFRSALFYRPEHPFDWTALATSTGMTLVLLVCAVYVFRRMETRFADMI